MYLDRVARLPHTIDARSWIVENLRVGHVPVRVAEIGCGNGDLIAGISDSLGEKCFATGYDFSKRFIESARKRHVSIPRLSFELADAICIPVQSAVCDAVIVERVLMHTSSPVEVLAEIARIIKPQGQLLLCESDWEQLSIDHSDRKFTRELISAYTGAIRHPSIVAELPALLASAGFAVTYRKDIDFCGNFAEAEQVLDFSRMTDIAVASGLSRISLETWLDQLREEKPGFHIALSAFSCTKS